MPPVTVKSIAPLAAPLQAAGVVVVDNARAGGWVTVAEAVAVQGLAFVTVTVYVPAVKPLGFWAVEPPVQT